MKPGDSSREKILFSLKTRGPQTAATLARRLRQTTVAARQHLDRLQEEGLVGFSEERRPVGRPARVWSLTDRGHARFPDSHAELTVGLLDALRQAFGEGGLAQLVERRTEAQLRQYRARMKGARSLEDRVAALVRIRSEEGYMAEHRRGRDGSLLLIENHCPICAAAEACQGLCTGELELFRSLLGRSATISREEHILSGARRCTYRITRTRNH